MSSDPNDQGKLEVAPVKADMHGLRNGVNAVVMGMHLVRSGGLHHAYLPLEVEAVEDLLARFHALPEQHPARESGLSLCCEIHRGLEALAALPEGAEVEGELLEALARLKAQFPSAGIRKAPSDAG